MDTTTPEAGTTDRKEKTRARAIRQQAKKNAKTAGQDWATLDKAGKRVFIDAVQTEVNGEAIERRAARAAKKAEQAAAKEAKGGDQA